MTNPVNNVSSTKTTGADMTALVEQLARRADLNRDGKISTSEFAEFLTGLLNPSASTTSSTASTAIKAASLETTPPPSATAPPGWDAVKWADPKHTTPKYVVGRILSAYPPTPDGLKQAMPALEAAYPGIKLAGKDSLNIPDVGIVDVGLSFSAGGNVGWWWGPK